MQKQGKKLVSGKRLRDCLCALTSLVVAESSALASNQLQPVLKSIDPTQAKMDTSQAPAAPPTTGGGSAPSPNPLGRVSGAPISGNRNPPSAPLAPYPIPQAPYGYPAPAYPAYPGYPPPGYGAPPGYPPANPYYPPPQQGYLPQQGYPPPQQGYPPPQQGGYPPPQQGGYSPQQQGYPPPQQGGYPPQQQAYPPQPQGGYAPPAQQYPSPVNTGGAPSGFPSESQIPDFGKPLPNVAAPGGGGNYGNGGGFVTQPPGGLGGPPQASPEEQRVQKLEQLAFGSTYPEHEVEDRVDHLEKEVFGSKSSDSDMSDRLSRLEAKLSGGSSAFGGSQSQSGSGSGSNIASAGGGTGGNQPASKNSYPAPKMVPPKKPPKQTEPKQSTTSQQLGEDYFTAVRRFGNDTVARWVNMPVRIHFPQGSPDSWQRSLDEGVAKWSPHLPLKVVAPSEPADIEVQWINHLVPQFLGITRLEVSNGQMRVQIYMLRPTYYLPEIPERTLASAFLHELGHAIGIFGHSDSIEDLMYGTEIAPGGKGKPSKIKYAPITTRDTNTLKKIYNSEPLPAGFSLPQPLEWGDSL